MQEMLDAWWDAHAFEYLVWMIILAVTGVAVLVWGFVEVVEAWLTERNRRRIARLFEPPGGE